jgi:hypothetical protein
MYTAYEVSSLEFVSLNCMYFYIPYVYATSCNKQSSEKKTVHSDTNKTAIVSNKSKDN